MYSIMNPFDTTVVAPKCYANDTWVSRQQTNVYDSYKTRYREQRYIVDGSLCRYDLVINYSFTRTEKLKV